MRTKIKNFSFFIFSIDFLLVNLSFFLMNYLKRDTFILTDKYIKLWLAYNFLAFIVSLLTRKFFINRYINLSKGIFLLLKSNVFLLYALSLLIVLWGLPAFSRLQVFGTVAFLTIFEVAVFITYYLLGGKEFVKESAAIKLGKPSVKNFKLSLFFNDLVLLTCCFFALNYYKRATFSLSEEYEKIFLLIIGLWLITGIFTRKFEWRTYRNFFYAFAPYLRAALLMVASWAAMVFALRWFFYSRLQIFGTFLLLLITEAIFIFLYYYLRRQEILNQDIESVDEVQKLIKQEWLEIHERNGRTHDNQPVRPIKEKLQQRYLKKYPGVFEFINEHINLDQIDVMETLVLDTHTPFNVENIDNNTLDLFINLHQVNDFRYINRYFLEVHKKFFNGGYFVGKANTIETHRRHFYQKYPRIFADLFYFINFLYARVLPKLPGIKRLYFAFTKGRKRVISRAEVLGRLYFCGFKVLDCRIIGDSFFYIAQKVKTPSFDRNPSYGPVIKLRRIGYRGEVIHIYKLRTMYPYSEYLQEYMFEHNNLQDNGKFKDDFRLTEWGKIFRKFFLDEIPQLINYFRGDVNLVGVRALSDQYFNLYPKEAQELRIQFKPGLVPPYYADMPNSLEEIVASEKRYLEQKIAHPLTTDIRYFTKAFYNIIFKKARSR